MTQEYFRFTEENDNEGETWNFFVPLTDEQEAKLRAAIANWDCYKLDAKRYSEAEVQRFMKHEACTSYMPKYNRCAPLNEAIPVDLEENDIFYKGGAFHVLQHNAC